MGYLDNTWHTILSDLGSIASFAGLGISVYVAWNLRHIKNSYIFRVRAPDFIKTVDKHAKILLKYGNDFAAAKQEIVAELVKADVRLRAMELRMRGSAKQAITDTRSHIEAYKADSSNRDKFDEVYNGFVRIVAEIEELVQDLNLE
jgi:hypothetical protein